VCPRIKKKTEKKFFRRRKKMTPSDEELVKWYDARDAFLGINGVPRNFRRGIELARALPPGEIPEATWLCNVFPVAASKLTLRMVVNTLAKMRTALASVYLELLREEEEEREDDVADYTDLARSEWHPLFVAVEVMREWMFAREEERSTYVRLAENREPRGFFCLWELDGRGPFDPNLKRAVDLGLVNAWDAYGREAFLPAEPQRYYWTGRAAQRGFGMGKFANEVSQCLASFLGGLGTSACILQIRKMLDSGLLDIRNEDAVCSQLHNSHMMNPEKSVRAMLYIRDLCEGWRKDAHNAVNAWTGVGRRKRVVKDIRIMIGKRIVKEWMRDVEYHPLVNDKNPDFLNAASFKFSMTSLVAADHMEKMMTLRNEAPVAWWSQK
jgi:hypothetical protein